MPDFRMASDLDQRLRALRHLYGETQKVFYKKRFDRSWKRGSAWENGAEVPEDRLVWAIEHQGWPREIFEESGPYPTVALEALRRLAAPRSRQGTPQGAPHQRERASVREMLEVYDQLERKVLDKWITEGKHPEVQEVLGMFRLLLQAGGAISLPGATRPEEPHSPSPARTPAGSGGSLPSSAEGQSE